MLRLVTTSSTATTTSICWHDWGWRSWRSLSATKLLRMLSLYHPTKVK